MKKKETQLEINMDSIKVESQNDSIRITTDDFQIICEPIKDDQLIFKLKSMNEENKKNITLAVDPFNNEIFIAKKLFEVLMIAYAEGQKPKESPLH